MKKILLQGVTPDTHLVAVRNLLRIPDPDRIVISVAFLNEAGLSMLQDALAPVAERTTIIVGIRNGITTVQGLSKCLDIGCLTYVADTGSRNVIFHPKLYLSRNAVEAQLIVGSANLTVGGLNSNIEASLCLALPLDRPENTALVTDVESKVDTMLDEYTQHMTRIQNQSMLTDLLESGRVADERQRFAPVSSGISDSRDLDTVPRINLQTGPLSRPRISQDLRLTESTPVYPPDPVRPSPERMTLAWQSNALTRRHLTIPTGANTNPTGSMLFGKGAMTNIDQRHYFRDDVFAKLRWNFDLTPKRQHIERAEAWFQLVIRDVDYGTFKLRLSHNSRIDTVAYQQGNSVTSLHWGDARRLVAREDLLGRTMHVYANAERDDLYILEID